MLPGLQYLGQRLRQANNLRAFATASKSGKLPKSTKSEVDEQLLPVVTLVGKPNVGKSALFNRLIQRRDALVQNTPDGHVTRDYRQGQGTLGDLWFRVMDTSGLEPDGDSGSIQTRATKMTASILGQTDAVVFLLDAREGMTAKDETLARWLQANASAPIILTVNKAESQRAASASVQDMLSEATRLGMGEAVAISAETGEGMVDLYTALQPIVDESRAHRQLLYDLHQKDCAIDRKLNRVNVAVVGVPNVGKSTLMNQLLGKQRSMTGPEPGLTRDAVSDSIQYKGMQIDLIDTAGWLDRGRLRGLELGNLFFTAQLQTQRSYNRAHIVLLVIDATKVQEGDHGLLRRELALARDIVMEGRAIVAVLNKFDALDPRNQLQVEAIVERHLHQSLPEVQGAALLSLSALTGQGVDAVLPTILQSFSVWTQRISTSALNKWLVKTAERLSLNDGESQILRVRYVTQVSSRPPTFVAFCSGTAPYPQTSIRFIGNALRQEFGFNGVPLRIEIRLRGSPRKQSNSRKLNGKRKSQA